MPPLYQIVDWDAHFENSKSRTFNRCSYACQPNKHGGIGWSNLMALPDGSAIYGVWCMIVQVCSRQQKPRDGWLTVDGKKDGRRLTAAAIANMLRRPVGEVQRCLEVTCSLDVGFMRLIDGEHQATNIPAIFSQSPQPIPQYDSSIPNPERPPQGQSEDTASAQPVSPPVKDREIDRKIDRPPTIPQGDVACEDPDPIQYAEAKQWINGLFHRRRAWSYEEDHLLADILPLSRADKRLIDWAYGLEPAHEFFEHTRLSQEVTTFLRNFNGVLDRIRSVRRKLELPDICENKKNGAAAPNDNGWTPHNRAAAVAIYGDAAAGNFVRPFTVLPPDIQRRIESYQLEPEQLT